MARLITPTAVMAGRLLNLSDLGAQVGVDAKTVDRWLTMLEHMFLIRRVQAWHYSKFKRLVKIPKIQFLDSGLLASLQRASATEIARSRQKLGSLLESFVHTEITKAIAIWDDATNRTISIRHVMEPKFGPLKQRNTITLRLQRVLSSTESNFRTTRLGPVEFLLTDW